jgi:hypothetical protein
MRQFICVASFALLTIAGATITGATAVRADNWCMRDSSGMGISICAFSSGEDCVRTALINPAGGICAREGFRTPTATVAAAKPRQSRTPPRRRRTDR